MVARLLLPRLGRTIPRRGANRYSFRIRRPDGSNGDDGEDDDDDDDEDYNDVDDGGSKKITTMQQSRDPQHHGHDE